MKPLKMLVIIPFLGMASLGYAGDTADAAVGGGLGGALGGALGSEIGGRNGAILGSAVGAAAGTAIATDGNNQGHEHVRDEHVHSYSGEGTYHPQRFCPPGQGKKGNC